MQNPALKIVVPIAWKLEWEGDKVVCGEGTREACEYAVEIARELPLSTILLTPTVAPAFGVVMAGVMDRYVQNLAPRANRYVQEADSFDTLGEVVATASYMQALQASGTKVDEVIFTVKSWHAPRLRMIVRRVFEGRDIAVPVRIETHHVPASWKDRYLHEWIAYWLNYWYKLPKRGY